MKVKILIIVLGFISNFICAQEDVFSVISNSENHTIFTDLLLHTGFDELLRDDDYYSVFAPDDEAFLNSYTVEQIDSLKIDEEGFLYELVGQHLVPDSIDLPIQDGPYLPVSGNLLNIFIDGAGVVLIVGGTSVTPYTSLMYAHNSDDVATQASNGQVLWTARNPIIRRCEPVSNMIEYNFIMLRAITATGLMDSISQLEEPVTILQPRQNVTNEYIEANGGFEMTSFLDSFVRRHFINGLYPYQKIHDGLVVENWLGEQVTFTVENEAYFVNDEKITNFTDIKTSVGLFLDHHILEQEVSIIIEETLNKFKMSPNPASQILEVELLESYDKGVISIINLDGQVLFEKEVLDSNLLIDLSTFDSGVYFVNYLAGQKVETEKLLINK